MQSVFFYNTSTSSWLSRLHWLKWLSFYLIIKKKSDNQENQGNQFNPARQCDFFFNNLMHPHTNERSFCFLRTFNPQSTNVRHPPIEGSHLFPLINSTENRSLGDNENIIFLLICVNLLTTKFSNNSRIIHGHSCFKRKNINSHKWP